MIDRQLIGDVAIAFLLAVPTVALSRPQPSVDEKPEISSPLIDREGFSDETRGNGAAAAKTRPVQPSTGSD